MDSVADSLLNASVFEIVLEILADDSDHLYRFVGFDHRDFQSSAPLDAMTLIPCSLCSRPVATSRFAAHLERCMGIGGRRRTRPTRSTIV
ncbi:hypothetical protein GEMRC1_008659 [Eukaryota sp. GEM-RC1]